jgi:hypothetical protein
MLCLTSWNTTGFRQVAEMSEPVGRVWFGDLPVPIEVGCGTDGSGAVRPEHGSANLEGAVSEPLAQSEWLYFPSESPAAP